MTKKPRPAKSPTPFHVSRNQVYSDDEESYRGLSDHSEPEYTSRPYTIMSQHQEHRYNNQSYNSPRAPSLPPRGNSYNRTDVMSGAYVLSPPEFNGGVSPGSNTMETRNSRNADLPVETMTPPSPFCLSIKGMCCLMVLLNLAIILAILGFLIVFLIPFFEPIYLWIFGIIFSVFGFLTLVVTVRVHMGVPGAAESSSLCLRCSNC